MATPVSARAGASFSTTSTPDSALKTPASEGGHAGRSVLDALVAGVPTGHRVARTPKTVDRINEDSERVKVRGLARKAAHLGRRTHDQLVRSDWGAGCAASAPTAARRRRRRTTASRRRVWACHAASAVSALGRGGEHNLLNLHCARHATTACCCVTHCAGMRQ
jgi:hypothetical protein